MVEVAFYRTRIPEVIPAAVDAKGGVTTTVDENDNDITVIQIQVAKPRFGIFFRIRTSQTNWQSFIA